MLAPPSGGLAPPPMRNPGAAPGNNGFVWQHSPTTVGKLNCNEASLCKYHRLLLELTHRKFYDKIFTSESHHSLSISLL